MTDLHDRFASFERLPAPDVWPDVLHRVAHPRQSPRWGIATISTSMALAGGALIVMVMLVSLYAFNSNVSGPPEPTSTPHGSATTSTPTRTPTPVPTPPPTPFPSLRGVPDPGELPRGVLDPGAYTYNLDGTLVNVSFTVPAGWEWGDRQLSTGTAGSGGAVIAFVTERVQVYTDPCHWATAEANPSTTTTVYGLMTALVAQPMRNATPAIDRYADSIGRPDAWFGRALELSVPEDLDLADCDQGEFRTWGPERAWTSSPGERSLVWAVEINAGGERIIITAVSHAGTPADVLAEVEDILDSIVLGHWG